MIDTLDTSANPKTVAELLTPRLGAAILVSVVGHIIFWTGVFFEYGHFPRIQQRVFREGGSGLPRLWVWGVVMALFAFLGWLTYGGGAWHLYPADAAQSFTDHAFLARLTVYFIGWELLIILVFPLLMFYAVPYTPIFIGGGNVTVMFLIITLGQGGVHLTLQSVVALAVLITTAVGFSWVMTLRQKSHQT